MSRQFWQIGSGDSERDYADLFLQHDVMLLGPGDPGEFEEDKYLRIVGTGPYNAHHAGKVRSFCRAVQPGDVVLLRSKYRVRSIGVVPEGEGYAWDDRFDDVFGWDLQHTQRVCWQEQLHEELEKIQAGSGLFASRKQIPAFTRVRDRAVLEPIRHLVDACEAAPLEDLPDPLPEILSLERLGEELFKSGLANDAIDRAMSVIERARRLCEWYWEQGQQTSRPNEHEVVAHLLLPLLLSLGWSEQLLAVEWRKVDLAAFRRSPTTAKNCALVCEAKSPHHGLIGAREQALKYVESLGLRECRTVLVTQGNRYYLYRRRNRQWEQEPSGYVNLEKIRTRHLLPAGCNGVDTLMALTPQGVLGR